LDWGAVRTYLATHGHRLDADPPPRQFAGGLANLNYLIHLDGKPAVLRRPPMGKLPAGAYDMAREFRILSRLPDALPFIARGLHLCEDPAIIGQRFQIIEYRAGLVIREHLPADLAHRRRLRRAVAGLLETCGDPCRGHQGGRTGRSRRPGSWRGGLGWRKRG
jgi:aminoglycoside phosphotransferase (APT) family kinase protein